MCFKEGFCQPTKAPKIAMVTADDIPEVRDGPKGRKLKRKHIETREGYQVHIILGRSGIGSLR